MLLKTNFDKTTEGKITEKERKKIIKKYRELITASEIFSQKKELEFIRKAFDIALEVHENKRLPSGEPFIIELLNIAIIIVEQIGLGTRSVIASLLYYAVIDEKITLIEVEKQFDKKIRLIVDGLIKLAD
ncbi:MAG: HD domain-containing protein, partial [Bacteroidota bacterium]